MPLKLPLAIHLASIISKLWFFSMDVDFLLGKICLAMMNHFNLRYSLFVRIHLGMKSCLYCLIYPSLILLKTKTLVHAMYYWIFFYQKNLHKSLDISCLCSVDVLEEIINEPLTSIVKFCQGNQFFLVRWLSL